MNKKDVDDIAYILAEAFNRGIPFIDYWVEKLSEIDDRIKDECEGYTEIFERDEKVRKRYEELMIEKYGHAYDLIKRNEEFVKFSKQAWKTAESENPL